MLFTTIIGPSLRQLRIELPRHPLGMHCEQMVCSGALDSTLMYVHSQAK